jgi:hypothetical protein
MESKEVKETGKSNKQVGKTKQTNKKVSNI